MGRHLGEHGRIVGGIDDHRHPIVILGCGADHGGAAHIDVLDCIVPIGAARHGGLERIEVDRQEIDVGDAMGGLRRPMLGVAAHRQQSAMHLWVQGFHAAIHDFGKTGKACDIGYRKARGCQRPGGAAG